MSTDPPRPARAWLAPLATGLAFALVDGVASGLLRLPASLWAAELLLGLALAGAALALTLVARRAELAGALTLAALVALQGLALVSKELAGGARGAGLVLVVLGASLALGLGAKRRGTWRAAALLPVASGLALGGAPWLALAAGVLAPLTLLLPTRHGRALGGLALPLALFLHPQRPPGVTRLERPASAAPARQGPNVVLLVIDTLRADELPPGGALEAFAREGLRFTQCVATAPWTLPSMSSLLTSLHPSQHGALDASTPLPLAVETLAEHFAAAGYRTGAFTGGAFVGPGHRLDQGFECFDAGEERRFPALGPHLPLAWQLAKNRYLPLRALVRAVDEYRGLAGVLAAADAWLAREPARPTFLLLHTYQAHDYYLYDADTDDPVRAAGPPVSARFATRLSVHPSELATASQADLDHFRALYRGRIRAIDVLLPELRRTLGARLGPETYWVVTADHGEGFDAGLGRVHHGGRLHDDLLRVPLLIVGPGLTPRTVDDTVRHLDLGPTLLALCGLPPLARAAGVSLLPALAGEAAYPPLAFAEERAHGLALRSVRGAGWKWIRAPGVDLRYELASDPGETRPRPEPAPEELQAGWGQFEQLYPARALEEVELDAATRAHLQALGYVE